MIVACENSQQRGRFWRYDRNYIPSDPIRLAAQALDTETINHNKCTRLVVYFDDGSWTSVESVK